ncbi:MAG TPA: HIT domain-containing protein [Luteimonas sp.]|nr:HIT domain-containing protein [Luteimonas sp.]
MAAADPAAPAFALDERIAADSHPVESLTLCELRLMDDAQYPWLVLVPRIAGARELIDLDPALRVQLGAETDQAARLLRRLVAPDKLNVASLGNVVEQLHVHVVARFVADAAWPAPVWGRLPMQPYARDARDSMVSRLRALLDA